MQREEQMKRQNENTPDEIEIGTDEENNCKGKRSLKNPKKKNK